MKDNPKPQTDDNRTRKPSGQPAAPQTGKNPRDARDTREQGDVDRSKLKDNQRELGVTNRT
jgi:hypothetical protein